MNKYQPKMFNPQPKADWFDEAGEWIGIVAFIAVAIVVVSQVMRIF